MNPRRDPSRSAEEHLGAMSFLLAYVWQTADRFADSLTGAQHANCDRRNSRAVDDYLLDKMCWAIKNRPNEIIASAEDFDGYVELVIAECVQKSGPLDSETLARLRSLIWRAYNCGCITMARVILRPNGYATEAEFAARLEEVVVEVALKRDQYVGVSYLPNLFQKNRENFARVLRKLFSRDGFELLLRRMADAFLAEDNIVKMTCGNGDGTPPSETDMDVARKFILRSRPGADAWIKREVASVFGAVEE